MLRLANAQVMSYNILLKNNIDPSLHQSRAFLVLTELKALQCTALDEIDVNSRNNPDKKQYFHHASRSYVSHH